MKVLVIDNYDSFTYNLVHILDQYIPEDYEVVRNDQVTAQYAHSFDKILISPGPGLPSDAGITCDVIREFGATKSILGVCLGHQAIAECYGGKLFNLSKVMHGIATPTIITDPEENLFSGLPVEIITGRYHSWMVDKNNFPASLKITAVDPSQEIMALRHTTYDVKGIQFHPESVMTPLGKKILYNWLFSSFR